MTKKAIYYLSVDLDREIFKDESGKEYTTEQVKRMKEMTLMCDTLEVNTTMMAARLIYHFNYDFQQARDFYNTK